uniref:Integrase catalytic domain-containing protein n=1 Tax=Tanacetum cinerariifolium TaxID=118510 RepID=A0A6L2NNB0_TANCI|nr:hypothetical protein [Tanacetum cinerariifolium]
MRQRHWIELLSDYDYEIRYHPSKGNVVADALSRKDREPLRVRSLVMTVHTNLPKKMLEAQTEVKAEHQNHPVYSNNLKFLSGKGEKITMDFVSGLPRTPRGYDSIWVIVDRLTKHEVPVTIISNRDSLFTSSFWETLQKALGTQLNLSTAYHSEMDGQSERSIQTLEDMLRA